MDDVLVVGEALVDVVRSGDRVTAYPGGSAANAAVALARLGRDVRLWTAYARDAHGETLDRHLEAAGVQLACRPHVLDRTPTATATIGPDGAASYAFDVEWMLTETPSPPARYLHVCSWAPVLDPGAQRVLELGATSRALTYDINVRPGVTGDGQRLRAAVERTARLALLVKASDEDLEVLYPELATAAAAERLLELGPQAVVVTRGAAGATWFGTRDTISVGGVPAEVADTIGAGDTFGAALLDALWDDSIETIAPARITAALSYAARAAAIAVSRPGADPPYAHELAPGRP